MNRLRQLQDHGQSVWIDNLARQMVRSGELKRRADEEGIRGVTSNPVIFHKAISGSAEYDQQIAELFAQGKGTKEVYEALVTTDVREACDALRPVWEATGGREGFVSLEVSPLLARDTQGSIQEARYLHSWVDRPNLMIKIPGTVEGIPAAEQLIYEGIDVNITLLFAVDRYEAVAEAYMRALERRLAEGKAIDRSASVASFFLSRIDVLVDERLSAMVDGESHPGCPPVPQSLLGKAAVANAKLAYQVSLRLGAGERWRGLAAKGAHPQRLLWASTSTKNPKYQDTMYVEPLVGPHTVNTMPNETIAAVLDHGNIQPNTVTQGLSEAHQVMEDLAKLGIDMRQVTDQLEEEGIDKFVKPFEALLALIESKRA